MASGESVKRKGWLGWIFSAGLLVAAAGALAVGAAIVLIDDLPWLLDLLSFAWFYAAAGSVVLCLFSVIVGRRVAAVIALLAAIVWALPWWQLPTAPTVAACDLRVVTANLLIESNATPDRLVAFVLAEKPDLLVMQEVRPAWADAVRATGLFPFESEGVLPLNDDMKVFSRLPIVSQAPVAGVRENSQGGRQPLRFELQTGGRPLVLYALHPETPRRYWQWLDRNLYLAGVARAASRDSATADVIAAGDFNTVLASPYFHRLLADGGLFATGDGPPWEPTRFTLKLHPPLLVGATIDHVLVSGAFGVAGRRTGPAFGSDHLPVAVDLGLTGQQADAPPPFVQNSCGRG